MKTVVKPLSAGKLPLHYGRKYISPRSAYNKDLETDAKETLYGVAVSCLRSRHLSTEEYTYAPRQYMRVERDTQEFERLNRSSIPRQSCPAKAADDVLTKTLRRPSSGHVACEPKRRPHQ